MSEPVFLGLDLDGDSVFGISDVPLTEGISQHPFKFQCLGDLQAKLIPPPNAMLVAGETSEETHRLRYVSRVSEITENESGGACSPVYRVFFSVKTSSGIPLVFPVNYLRLRRMSDTTDTHFKATIKTSTGDFPLPTPLPRDPYIFDSRLHGFLESPESHIQATLRCGLYTREDGSRWVRIPGPATQPTSLRGARYIPLEYIKSVYTETKTAEQVAAEINTSKPLEDTPQGYVNTGKRPMTDIVDDIRKRLQTMEQITRDMGSVTPPTRSILMLRNFSDLGRLYAEYVPIFRDSNDPFDVFKDSKTLNTRPLDFLHVLITRVMSQIAQTRQHFPDDWSLVVGAIENAVILLAYLHTLIGQQSIEGQSKTPDSEPLNKPTATPNTPNA